MNCYLASSKVLPAGAEIGRNMMRKMLMMLVTSWIWWGATSVSGAADVSFDTKDATEETYFDFLDEVRAELESGFVKHGFAVMRRKSTVQSAKQRFRLVMLTNSAGKNITLALDVVTAQLVGYRATDSRSFFFLDAPKPESESLFLDTNQTTFNFTGSYTDLTGVAQEDRSAIQLGMKPLSTAIQDLHDWTSGSQTELAHGLLVIIQMVSEAARISYIQRALANWGWGHDDFTPSCAVISYEDNWVLLSSAIQTMVNGKFRNPVELERGNCKKYNVTTVTENLQIDLALLKSILAISPSSQVISSVLQLKIKKTSMAVRKFNPGRRHNKWTFTNRA